MIHYIIQKIKYIISFSKQSVVVKTPEEIDTTVDLPILIESVPTIDPVVIPEPEVIPEPVVVNKNITLKSKAQLNAMTKDKLEAYGRTLGIELDKRKTKSVLIEQLLNHASVKGE